MDSVLDGVKLGFLAADVSVAAAMTLCASSSRKRGTAYSVYFDSNRFGKYIRTCKSGLHYANPLAE